jgi:hypothetical protein
VTATPEPFEVLPGPGMPSLESLGITSADLFNTTFVDELLAPLRATAAEETSSISRRWTDQCDRDPRGPTGGVLACAAYLVALNTRDCTATNTVRRMCTSNADGFTAIVEGISIKVGSTRSYCRDAAQGVYWVANRCTILHPAFGIHIAAGAAAAYGNGDLIMIVSGNFD